ncbi:1-phosphofructokinase family hexose kinase [Mycetocola zhadangensis]|uniref:1-phosphofructokinase family hexose kinase n=1 Tax=Mycetocola zhadangensis TaxID=1164595 RepID=A0A3L7J1Q4_9MICO|nr:1-phosphofructokinase family hexose kinase [Mycetocola zhadangensis]RLQ84437.1 1-phosphofructokinase family hexose kinase [Mycetocola zhadangensis]GGE93036.1 1-phosphofructokinase [Mycetocola zhadangensis]
MIVTVTLNPSFDRTIDLDAPLERGQVQRAARAIQEPGGKGVNVSRALHTAGVYTLAILPGAATDPMVLALLADRIPAETVPVTAAIRSNTTITEPGGTTTKLNEPGAALSPETATALLDLIVSRSADATWLVLAGSVPPGLPTDFYARIVREVRSAADRNGLAAPRIAVDSSGEPLAALLASDQNVDLIKPNAEELFELASSLGIVVPDIDPESLGFDDDTVITIADQVLEHGLGAALITLGSRGAVLATPTEVLRAAAPRIVARSTVGAGDCSLAGFLLASERGDDAAGCLAQAVAHGAAAASLPGSSVPTLEQADSGTIAVTRSPRVLTE